VDYPVIVTTAAVSTTALQIDYVDPVHDRGNLGTGARLSSGRGCTKRVVNTPAVDSFRAASQFFADAVAAVPTERYVEMWSDQWRVLDLIGHGRRAVVLPVEYYERPVPVAGPEYALPESIAERGRQAVRELGDDPVIAVRTAVDRALAVVAAAPDDATVGTPFGRQALDDYLRSRTAELVIHGLDLDSGTEPPTMAVTGCGVFLIERAVHAGHGVAVLRGLSGRAPLPAQFSVY
jgi:hypothetical protein